MALSYCFISHIYFIFTVQTHYNEILRRCCSLLLTRNVGEFYTLYIFHIQTDFYFCHCFKGFRLFSTQQLNYLISFSSIFHNCASTLPISIVESFNYPQLMSSNCLFYSCATIPIALVKLPNQLQFYISQLCQYITYIYS